jgi:hypothetical protein
MVYLTKGQKLFENDAMVVYDQTGYYEDDASVICAMAFAPEEPVCRYEAKFVAYGGMVYAISEPEKLLEEVIKIDPKSLFGKSNANLAADRVVENIQTVDSETPTTEEVTVPEETEVVPEETPAETSAETPTETSTTTPETTVPTEEPIVIAPEAEVTLPVTEEPDIPIVETIVDTNTSTTTAESI